MSDHIRLRATVRIRDGRYDHFRAACEALAARVAEKDRTTVSYSAFVNEETAEGFFLEHYENSEAMLSHIDNCEGLFPPIFDLCQPLMTEVYGDPSEAARVALESFDTSLVIVSQVADAAG